MIGYHGTIWERAPFRKIWTRLWDASRGVQRILGGNGARYENNLNKGGSTMGDWPRSGNGPRYGRH